MVPESAPSKNANSVIKIIGLDRAPPIEDITEIRGYSTVPKAVDKTMAAVLVALKVQRRTHCTHRDGLLAMDTKKKTYRGGPIVTTRTTHIQIYIEKCTLSPIPLLQLQRLLSVALDCAALFATGAPHRLGARKSHLGGQRLHQEASGL